MTGIEAFKNLEILHCSRNSITELDCSNNIYLEDIWCASSTLSSLDISKCQACTTLVCCGTKLTSLDVSNNTALEFIAFNNNPILELDISNLKSLKYLICYGNQLTSLDVTNNTAPISLEISNYCCFCDGNPYDFTQLDLSNNPKLEVLVCCYHQISSLDVKANTALHSLSCGGYNPKSQCLFHHRLQPIKNPDRFRSRFFEGGDSAEVRTQDPILKRDVLYQLSY